MTKNQIAWCIFCTLFVLPFLAHFVINLYWWLFDGNVLIEDKMGASAIGIIVGLFIAGAWADWWNVWKK